MNEWTCSCGQKNTSKFCTRCGKAKPVVDLSKSNDNLWTCSCGKKNAGDFCTNCGQRRMSPPSNDTNTPINSATDSPTQLRNDKRNFIIIGLLVVIMGLIGTVTYLLMKEKPAEIATDDPPAEPVHERQDGRLTESVAPPTPTAPAPKPEVKVKVSDLALGDISIGFSKEQVYNLIGLESQITDPEFSGHLRYQYPDMEVIITRNVVTAFVSKTARVSTSRGVHQGSSLTDVTNAYGEGYTSFEHEGKVLYEYPFTSTDGRRCLLRFAVKNGFVDYISGRAIDMSDGDPYDGAHETFREYYRFITEKKYRNAYEILSVKQKERRGTFDEFINSYSNTISNEIENIGVRSVDATNFSIEYLLVTRDRLSNGRIKIQRFRGEAILVYRDSRWLIDYAKSSKISEHME